MINLMFILWIVVMILVIAIPIVMIKKGIYLSGRDLFFTFIGMLVMSGFSLIAIFPLIDK